MTNIKQALSLGGKMLQKSSPTPHLDAEVLLCKIIKRSKTYLFTYPENTINTAQLNDFTNLINQRKEGMPIAYLVGEQEFWSLKLQVSPATLIPRCDTELLVTKTLEKIQKLNADVKILEMGTGTGAISLAIASEYPDLQILATDISPATLEIAQNNAKALAIRNVKFILSDWYANIGAEKFDFIISNPPYIEANDPHLKQGDVRFEPKNALISGSDGLESLTYIIENANEHLTKDGIILIEHGYNQRIAVANLLKINGFQDIICWQDLAGNDRVSYGLKQG